MCRRAGRKENELNNGLHSIRAACLRSFPEFLADLRASALGKGGELSTGLADFTLSVRDAFLVMLSLRSWRVDCSIRRATS